MKETNQSLTNSRFGKWGWSMIIVAFIWYYFWAGTGVDGLNVYPGAFSAAYGWDYNVLLGFATPAGFISVIGGVLFGHLVLKWNVRKVASLTMILVGILYLAFGYVTTPILYFICLTAFTFFGNAFGLVCTSTLMANWFPKKKGIALGWATMGAPDQERYRPVFQKAAELGAYVYIHPHLPDMARMEDYGFTLAGPGLGFTLDTMVTFTRMAVSGLFDEIPELKVVLGHLGEALPFLLDRMDNRLSFLPNPLIRSNHTLRYYFQHNIIVTTSGNESKEAFACAKEVAGMDHICFASDYPYEDMNEITDFLDEVPISQKERQMLFYENAITHLGIRP